VQEEAVAARVRQGRRRGRKRRGRCIGGDGDDGFFWVGDGPGWAMALECPWMENGLGWAMALDGAWMDGWMGREGGRGEAGVCDRLFFDEK